ncbi:PTS transporter subunit EIIC [Anaerorhabdus sp.]|uniref:PTS transporter subunit EIIC n=1 Tax=Anaerorhabdus sp. TaxID=1872524 RepID=UPI002FC8B23B
MKYEQLIKSIIENVGGVKNINTAAHCLTRLRLTLRDKSLVNEGVLKNIDGVMGVVNNGSQTQVVIGPEVSNVYREFLEVTGLKEEETVDENLDDLKSDLKNKKGNILTTFFETIAGIFNPIVPALAGAGLVKAILTIAVVCGLDNTGNTYFVINTIANGIFTFLPFLLAASAAKQFKMNQFVALTICAAMMSSNWAGLIAEGTTSFSFLMIPFTVVNYASSVLPMVFAIWFASYVEKFVDKVIPGALKIVLVPCLTMLIATPIALITIGPVATWIGLQLANIVTILFEKGGVFAGIIYGGVYSSMVVLGIHHGMVPVLVQGITTQGFNYISPTSGSANMAQAGAAFGVWLKSKNPKTKTIAASATIAAITGVTEPAIYGINFKFKTPFLAAAIGGACGGGFASFFMLKAYAMGGPSFLNFAMFIGENPSNVWLVMAAFAIAFIVAAVLTIVFKFDENM